MAEHVEIEIGGVAPKVLTGSGATALPVVLLRDGAYCTVASLSLNHTKSSGYGF